MTSDTVSLTDYLRDHGVKPSAQRIAIMRYMVEHHDHPTADDIHLALVGDMPTLSRTTVYNTLWLLVENNALMSLDIDRTNVRFDYATRPHAHFMCRRCGTLYDIDLDPTSIGADIGAGVAVEQVSVNYRGLCRDCSRHSEQKD